MTYEEVLKLQPGDKVVFTVDLPKILEIQDKNDGFLTVKEKCRYECNHFTVEEFDPNYWFSYSWIEFYKPQPWSYERDY